MNDKRLVSTILSDSRVRFKQLQLYENSEKLPVFTEFVDTR
jgi:hypothetical protein